MSSPTLDFLGHDGRGAALHRVMQASWLQQELTPKSQTLGGLADRGKEMPKS